MASEAFCDRLQKQCRKIKYLVLVRSNTEATSITPGTG